MIVRLLCLWRQEIVYKYEQEVTEVIIGEYLPSRWEYENTVKIFWDKIIFVNWCKIKQMRITYTIHKH